MIGGQSGLLIFWSNHKGGNDMEKTIMIKAVTKMSAIEAILIFAGGMAAGFYLTARKLANEQAKEETYEQD